MFKRLFAIVLSLCLLLGVSPVTMPTATVSAADITPISDSNFSFLWVSDPQIYTNDYPAILSAQNDWILANANRLNVKYAFHTGDLVHVYNDTSQWEFVSKEYQKWDDAGFSYGVLAGNHDMSGTDYALYSQYFGKSRYENNWWYGGDYNNNYGHYDLRSTSGVDFIFVYLSYGNHTQADYDWVNSVLKEHSDRIAVLCFHDYMATTGGRSEAGELLFDNIVLKNPNVRMVLCGHNYNSNRAVDEIDDTGDGIADRTVYQIMANYQYTSNGGNGFIRFMECDVENGTITHRTYSPYTASFGSDYEDGTVLDEFGLRDSFVTPFDFSTPHAKETSDPAVGKVVYSKEMSFAPTDTHSAVTLPVTYQNTREAGSAFRGVGVYDRFFSLDATDAFSDPTALNYVVTEYTQTNGYTVKKVIKGASLNAAAPRVPIPKHGAVIALPADAAIDLNTVTVGRKVMLNKLADITTPSTLKATNLTVPSWGMSYTIDAINRQVGNGDWVLYDALSEKRYSHDYDLLFAFSPAGNNAYTLTAAATTVGESKALSVPSGGFVLATSAVNATAAWDDSMTALFKPGLTVTLNGHTPGQPISHTTVSLLAPSASQWTKDSTMVVTQSGNTQVFYNTDSLYPNADYTFATPVTFDPSSMKLAYDYLLETDARTSIVLFFDSPSGDQPVTIQSYFEGGTLSTKSGDLKGDDVRRNGKIDAAAMAIPAECYRSDGTLAINAIRIFASGAANKQLQFHTLAVTTDIGVSEDQIAQNMPLLSDRITVNTPAATGSYIYDNGELTITSDSSDGYSLTVELGNTFDVTALSNLLVDAESTVRFDIRPLFTTAGDDASYGLVSDLYPAMGVSLDNGLIPAGTYDVALDLLGCYRWNQVIPADGLSTVKTVTIQLGGIGTLKLNALQVSNTAETARFVDGRYVSGTTPSVTIESDVYAIGDSFVEQIATNTTVSTLLTNIRSSSPLTVTQNGATVEATALVATDMVIASADGSVSRTLAVIGDIDGDGDSSTTDARYCLMKILEDNAVSLTAAQKRVADRDSNGTVNTGDVRDLLIAIVTN